MDRNPSTLVEAFAPLVSWSEASRRAERDRRAHERLVAHELEWLHSARLRSGPPLSLIDLSAGGALFETSAPLGPGTTSALTLAGDGIAETAMFRLLRCEVTSIKHGPVYRGACVFDRVLRLPPSTPAPAARVLDVAGPLDDQVPSAVADEQIR